MTPGRCCWAVSPVVSALRDRRGCLASRIAAATARLRARACAALKACAREDDRAGVWMTPGGAAMAPASVPLAALRSVSIPRSWSWTRRCTHPPAASKTASPPSPNSTTATATPSSTSSTASPPAPASHHRRQQQRLARRVELLLGVAESSQLRRLQLDGAQLAHHLAVRVDHTSPILAVPRLVGSGT